MRRIDRALALASAAAALTALLLTATGSVIAAPAFPTQTPSTAAAPTTSPLSSPTPSPAPVSYVPYPQKQVLVLMYHQVTNTPDGANLGAGHYGPAVSPKDFNADLAYLERHGFSPVDPLAAMRYLSGQTDASTLPARPYAITFDDGFDSAWTQATPILRRHKAKAMMFVEGMRVDLTPGRLTSAQIRAMVHSGVWEIESHGYTGHWALQIGPNPSDLSPYWYANLAWLPDAKRLETTAEFEARLLADFKRSRQTLAQLSGKPVTVFAYPSGEYGQNVPLPPGANTDVFAGEEGHSNASRLTPLIDEALRRSGFDQAVAVVVPGTEMAASPADAPYRFPRSGESPQKSDPDVAVMTDGEMKLPAISPDYQWLDCKPVSADANALWVAGASAPYLYQLDALTGRTKQVVRVAQLQAGREKQPVLAAGLMQEPDGSFVVYQQKGWWDGGQARLVTFRLAGDSVVDAKTQLLSEDAAWFVGVTLNGTQVVGMTEEGQFYALGTAGVQSLFIVPNDAPGWKADDVGRFAGLAFARGLYYVVDRKAGQLMGIDPGNGAIKESSALPKGVDIRAVGGDDHYLWLVDYGQERRVVIRMRASGSHP